MSDFISCILLSEDITTITIECNFLIFPVTPYCFPVPTDCPLSLVLSTPLNTLDITQHLGQSTRRDLVTTLHMLFTKQRGSNKPCQIDHTLKMIINLEICMEKVKEKCSKGEDARVFISSLLSETGHNTAQGTEKKDDKKSRG